MTITMTIIVFLLIRLTQHYSEIDSSITIKIERYTTNQINGNVVDVVYAWYSPQG